MPSNSENDKRILKNTLILYFRQIIIIIVALFTTRVVLQTLGVTDFGINNIVSSIVAMFGFFCNALMRVTQRFFSVELGKGGNIAVLRKIFSTSMILHFIAGVIAIILAETVGLWFLNNKLVIPVERMAAANWVYQFIVFSFVLTVLGTPFIALIISHENMLIYGYMGIFDVVIRLITVYLLIIINADKLILFALFGFVITFIVRIFYFIYCRRKYREARFSFAYDKSLSKELAGFGKYIFIANIFWVFLNNGINIMLNIFYGIAINTARGLANSVNAALLSFGDNFKQALIPYITKSYTAGDKDFLWNLVERGTRITYFLFLVFSVPVLLKAEFILKLWLENVPEYTAIFIRFMVIINLTSTLTWTFGYVIDASGKIKTVYCVGYIANTIILILSYFVCKLNYPPQYIYVFMLLTQFLISFPVYFIFMKRSFNFPVFFFSKKQLFPCL